MIFYMKEKSIIFHACRAFLDFAKNIPVQLTTDFVLLCQNDTVTQFTAGIQA